MVDTAPTDIAGPTGLTSAQVRDRVTRGLVNTLQEAPSRSTREIVRANVVTRFNILLSALVLVILLVVRQPADALFGIVMVTNAAIGIVQELRAKATLDRLAVLTAPRSRVLRDGRSVEIPIEQIVVDDVVELRAGDQLPVDGVVVTARGLEIDESLLTGESDPVLKEPGMEGLSGSFVAAGSGRYRATRVGRDAYAASLAREAKRFTLVRSELRDGIDWILAAVSWAVGPMIALLVWSGLRADPDFRAAVSSAVAGAVGMVPQGLVLLTSIAFAVGVIRLGRRNVLVQELPAVEGLARVDTVCFDKTGTLTEGTLVVHQVVTLGDGDVPAALGALGASDPDPNATLRAMSAAFPAQSAWVADAATPFSSARKWSGASFGGRGTWVLGAPEVLAPDDDEIAAAAGEHAALGRRVLLASKTDLRLEADRLPRRLQPQALVVLGDRVRSDAAETLRYFAEQGVQAKVISGDHPDTVGAIARQVGVPGAHHVVDARTLPDEPAALARAVEEATVFGRVTPHQKRAMVQALQSRGHVVAMTGDGVNDVLALKDADIGIAIGTGSPASRAVAQLVLIDGGFHSLPGVVAEGRQVIGNIERVANLFVTKTIYSVFLALVVGFLAFAGPEGRPFPFLPRHLTLVGSVSIGIPAFFLALASDTSRARPGFVLRVMRFAVPSGLAAGIATFAAYELALSENVTLEQARTTATLVLAAIGLFAMGIVARPLVTWKRWLIGSMAGCLLLLFATEGSRVLFELRMPRVAVLLAAVGIVAITGAAMVGTLEAVGWVRQVPEILRESQPDAREAWRRMRRGASALVRRRRPGDQEGAAFVADEATEVPGVEVRPPPSDSVDRARQIDWLDPDFDPIDLLEPPTEESPGWR
ncbi:MAG TPA: HAD-IC family P-type ATPase [Acidimicrobiia bacterium]|jgi:cation-transporting ATPase E